MGFGIKAVLQKFYRNVFIERFPVIRLAMGDTTQHGEFNYLKKLTEGKTDGYIVDIGANNGYHCSNSYPFIQMGWSAVLVEPDPNASKKLHDLYDTNETRVQIFTCASGDKDMKLPLYLGIKGQSEYSTLSTDTSEWYKNTRSMETVDVDVVTLTKILKTANAPENIDILSIDTEGYDYKVLLGLNFSQFRPRLIITEDEKPPYKNLKEKELMLKTLGYSLVKQFHNNAIWMANG